MIDKKGFTLIELLAVITILGILMLVAIPAVSRTIENARKNTFITTAQTYVEAVRNSWAADEISCGPDDNRKVASALPVNQYYYVEFATDSTKEGFNNGAALIGDGGKSSWGSADVEGFVTVHVEEISTPGASADAPKSIKLTYYVSMVDTGGHGIDTTTVPADQLTRADVKVTSAALPTKTGTKCVVTG